MSLASLLSSLAPKSINDLFVTDETHETAMMIK